MSASNTLDTGMLNVVAVNDLLATMIKEPDPSPLYDCLWFEGELVCLFADTSVGKSILAVQIAEVISEHQPVLYVDCELTNKQFQMRYSNPELETFHYFPENFYRATIAPERIGSKNFEDALLEDIERAALSINSKVIILDNLTYACNTSEKGDAAGLFMMRLKKLQMCYGWSMLIIAHTPKREETDPIIINNLAGSKKLPNFFDRVFALGKSQEDDNYRYLKQLKVRSGESVYTEDNVMVLELEKSEDGSLHFIFRKYDKEESQLNAFREEDLDLAQDIVMMHNGGMSYRQIANKINVSKSRAQRIYKKYKDRVTPPMDGIAESFFGSGECPSVQDPMA